MERGVGYNLWDVGWVGAGVTFHLSTTTSGIKTLAVCKTTIMIIIIIAERSDVLFFDQSINQSCNKPIP